MNKLFERKKNYKAKEPYETITQIRGILKDLDIFVSEKNLYFDEPEIVSCRIWISDEAVRDCDFGTNGKGMNARYSLASAYGELMERLQNMILFGDYAENAYYKGMTKYMTAPDEVMLSAKESFENAKEVLTTLLRLKSAPILNGQTEKMPSVPYYDVFNDRTVLLPHKTLRMVIGSNGMAAGNTFKEAIVQGMSELYEREAVREAYEKNPKIRQLHPESFAGTAALAKLEKLRMYGFKYNILDLSMGKDYPVIGLRLEIGGAAAFRAGADPCPVTALERCITELFQGSSPDEVLARFRKDYFRPFGLLASERERKEVNDAEIAYHVDESGKLPDCIFNFSPEYSENFAGTCGESEEADYEYMMELTRKLGLGLYIRDWSFLGFPAYQIIIPEFSNYDLIFDRGEEVYNWSFEKQEFRLDKVTEGVAKMLNGMYEKYEKNVLLQTVQMIK